MAVVCFGLPLVLEDLLYTKQNWRIPPSSNGERTNTLSCQPFEGLVSFEVANMPHGGMWSSFFVCVGSFLGGAEVSQHILEEHNRERELPKMCCAHQKVSIFSSRVAEVTTI